MSGAPGGTIGVISPWLAAQLLNHGFGVAPFTPPAATWLGLFLPSFGSAAEITAADYVRQPITFNAASGDPPTLPSAADIQWAPAQMDWGNVIVGGVFDALTGGNFYGWGYLVAADGVTVVSMQVYAADIVKIPAGQVIVSLGLPVGSS